MDEAHSTVDDPRQGETAAARQHRIAREAVMVAQAMASAANGQTVLQEAFDAWIDSIGTNRELPPPKPDR